MRLLARVMRMSLTGRLWLTAGGLGVFVLTLAVGNCFLPAERAVTRDMLGHDFLAFYTAGHFAREGEFERMYDLQAVRRFQLDTAQEAGLELDGSFGPFWNPPFYAWVFVPLAGLPYRMALAIWWGVGGACLIGSIALLRGMLPRPVGWREAGLVPAAIVVSLPFHQALAHGQNTFVSLLILTAAVGLWLRALRVGEAAEGEDRARSARRWALVAGVVAGLMFYKPQLGAVVAVAMAVTLGRWAVAGLAMMGCVLLAITALSMPGIIEVYLERMPENLRWMQEENRYLWERHITFKAFWRLLLQGHETGPTSAAVRVLWVGSVAALGGALGMALWRRARAWGKKDAGDNRLIAATIASMPLLMPFYFDYDLLLMAIPAVLFAADVMRRGAGEAPGLERWLVRAWIVFFAYAMVSPALAGRSHFHGIVLPLAAIAGLSIARAWQAWPRERAAGVGERRASSLRAAA